MGGWYQKESLREDETKIMQKMLTLYIVIIYPIERFTKFMPICSRVLEIKKKYFEIRKIACVQSLLLYIRGAPISKPEWE